MNKDALAEVAESTDANKIVTFRLGEERLGLPISLIQEIIRVPSLSKVPSSEPSLLGVGNLRGQTLPVISLRKRLGLEDRAFDDSTRILVVNFGGVLNGLVVDSVAEVYHFENDKLDEPPATIAGIKDGFLKKVLRTDKEGDLILILCGEKIFPELDLKSLLEQQDQEMDIDIEKEKEGSQSGITKVVAFKVSKEECAFDIMQVKEIIRMSKVTPVPKTPKYVLGVMSLRNSLLPVLDLRSLFGQMSLEEELDLKYQELIASFDVNDENYEEVIKNFKEEFEDNKKLAIYSRRIMVVELHGLLTGILVDSVSQVLSVEQHLIDPPPPIIGGKDSNKIQGVAKLNQGKRIIMYLDLANLFDGDEVEKIKESAGDQTSIHRIEESVENGEEIQLVCFKLEDEEYAVDIMKVQEIIRVGEITCVPQSKKYMRGVINLRGSVAPVVDMRVRLGLGLQELNDQNRIIVMRIDSKSVGFVVDSVTEVLRMYSSDTEDTPGALSNGKDQFLKAIGKLEEGKRIISLIDEKLILQDDELQREIEETSLAGESVEQEAS
ncbi:MAG: chemotaxis protein CheW [Bdellovibrionota bacterium]|nr:chemotaxis protein CheW [Bdellovibrionota bacterium]